MLLIESRHILKIINRKEEHVIQAALQILGDTQALAEEQIETIMPITSIMSNFKCVALLATLDLPEVRETLRKLATIIRELDVRLVFENYNLISALHTYYSRQNEIYKNILPPISLLNKECEKNLFENLKKLDFSINQSMAA